MLMNATFAFLHFLAAFGICCTLFYEWLTFRKDLTCVEARHIQICDRWYGIFAAVVIAAGFLRVYYFEKGSEFYFSSPFFGVKLFLFLVIGLLSIYPTIRFIGWRKVTRAGKPPKISDRDFTVISLILNLQLWLLVALIFAASLMAKGILR